jgi:hypothetical protein
MVARIRQQAPCVETSGNCPFRGWGFSVADMARLGLPPVACQGPGRCGHDPAFKHWLIQLKPKHCQP